MFHLFNSAVRVEEMRMSQINGSPTMSWVPSTSTDPAVDAMYHFLKCRLDLNFIRPGKDVLPAQVAGKAPDRYGILFTFPYAPLRAGQRIVAIPNEYGDIPVTGTFDIRVVPDQAIDFSTRHHIEVQIVETAQNLVGVWPDGSAIQ